MNPLVIQARLQRYGLRAKKGLGQHFLWDETILDQIAAAAMFLEPLPFLEIGPGLGQLTEKLAQTNSAVWAIEADAALLPVLEEVTAPYPNVHVIHGDALTVDIGALISGDFVVAANLPYQITTPLLDRFLRMPGWRRMVIMVQKEAAQRIMAQPGGRDYGLLSIATAYFSDCRIVAEVPASAFVPPPHVQSQVICLDRAAQKVEAGAEALLATAKMALANRRKQLCNAPAGNRGKWLAALQAAGIDAQRRGETLSLEELSALTLALRN